MLNVDDATQPTFEVKVLVQFAQKGGGVKQGDFMAEFKRKDPAEVDRMVNDDVTHRELIDEVLVGVSGIGRSPSEPLPADEALEFVKKSPECVNAAAAAFFKATRAERYVDPISRKRAARG